MGSRTLDPRGLTLIALAVATAGCASRAPGQVSAADVMAASPGTKRSLMALATAARDGGAAADRRLASPAGPAVLTSVHAALPAQGVRFMAPQAATAVAPQGPVPATAEAKAPKAAPEIEKAAAPAPSVEVAPAVPKADLEPTGSPLIGFAIPAVAAVERILFQDGFDRGLAAWLSRGLGGAVAHSEDGLVLAAAKTRRTLWIKTREPIDLATSTHPRVRLAFKGAPASLKAVWATEHEGFVQETLLAATPPKGDGEAAGPEFDLADFKGRPGRLVLVAKAAKADAEAPVLDGVTVYDANQAAR